MRTVHFFIGECGAGKSTLAKAFAAQHRLPFLEGDEAIPEQLKSRFGLWLPPSLNTVDEFVDQHLTPAVCNFANEHLDTDVVVSQALYLNKHRYWIAGALMNDNAQRRVKFHWVRTPFFTHCRQLLSRVAGFRWLVYAMLNKPFFQRPTQEFEGVWNSARIKVAK